MVYTFQATTFFQSAVSKDQKTVARIKRRFLERKGGGGGGLGLFEQIPCMNIFLGHSMNSLILIFNFPLRECVFYTSPAPA